jgi:hypothetical protein
MPGTAYNNIIDVRKLPMAHFANLDRRPICHFHAMVDLNPSDVDPINGKNKNKCGE